jgi:acetyl esterase
MLDPQARALIDLMIERGVPPTHTLTPAQARSFYRDRRGFTQPEPPPMAEVQDLMAGSVPVTRSATNCPVSGASSTPLR